MKKLQNIVLRTLILLLPALLLAACETSKKSTEATNPISVFSHSSYNFAPANINIPTDGTRTSVANIFVNENEVKKLVAERLGIGDDQNAIAGLSYNANYTLSYRVNDASTSDANTFFAVAQNENNPFQVNILAGDTVGARLSFAGIIQLVPSFSVEVSISVPQATTASRRIIKTSVRVAFQERDADYSLNNVFTNNIARLSNDITFEPTAQVAENNRITAAATFSRRGSILSEYALQRDSSTAGITLFLALRETNDLTTECGGGAIYLDNTDLQVKTARTYNYEDASRPSYKCRLVISEDGINYQPLAIVAAAAAISTIDSRGNSIVGNLAPLPLNSNSVLVSPTSNSSIGCSATDPCYYADLNLEITNLDELPTIDASFTAFTPSNEGVGPLDVYESSAVRVSGNDLASGSFEDTSKRLTIIDRDWDPLTNIPLQVSEVIVAAVSPSHGNGAFSIGRTGTSDQYHLIVNRALLNYELFSANQLTSGKAIYKISIRATDDPVTDGGGSKSFTATFNFEVTDVVYRPLLVSSTVAAASILGSSTNAFSIEADIPTTQANSISVLSGAQALLNQLHRLGSFAAIDPETGDDSNLVYDIDASSAPAIAGNFGLINNSPRGRTLIISGTGLVQNANGALTLTAIHKNAQSIASPQASPRVSTDVTITVNDESYRSSLTDSILSSSTPRFQVIPSATIAEQTASAVVSYAGVNGGELTTLVAPSNNLRFGFAPVSLLGSAATDILQTGASFDTSKFEINQNTGRVTARDPGLTFAQPYVYNLLVYVASATDFATASDENTFLNNNAPLYDVARVVVVVQDTNAAPVATTSAGATINSTLPFRISVTESQAIAGAEVGRIMLSDDNDKTTDDFNLTAATNSAPKLFNIEWRDNGRGITGIVTLARSLDYENDNDRALNAQSFTLAIADSGEYSYNSVSSKAVPAVPATAQETITLLLNLDLQNVLEAPKLMAATELGSVSESATINTIIDASAGGKDMFRITNTNEINSSNLEYSVTGAFEAILAVVKPGTRVGNITSLELQVVDPAGLENLGDGRTFTAIITVRDLTSGLSSTINLPIMIINDSGNDFAIPSTAFQNLVILEQDVAANNLEISSSEIPAIDISRDYDDNFAGNNRLQSLVFDVVVTPTNTLDPVLSKVNALEVFQRGDSYFLRVADRDFIEQNLFGNLGFTVNARRALAATTATPSSVSSTLSVTAAASKLVTYANAADTALSPPVYAFNYEQSAYAATTTASEGQQVIPVADIIYNPLNILGVAANALIDLSGATYPTVALTDTTGRSYGNFIRRVTRSAGLTNKNNNALLAALSPNDLDQQSVIINFAQPRVLDELSGNFDILMPDSNGNLVDASREFNNHFTIGVINSADTNVGPQLNITQKVFQYSIGDDDTLLNYNSLDTIPLFDRSVRPLELNYFIRAYGEPRAPSNAASYALAQFSVVVTTSGGFVPPVPPVLTIQDYMVESFTADLEAGGVARLQWTNPANFTGTSIASLRIDIRNYTSAVSDTVGIAQEPSIQLSGDFLNPGRQTYSISGLPTGGYYEFDIIPTFTDNLQRGVVVTTNPRLLIINATFYTLANFTVTPLASEASLQWTNPVNFTDSTSITAINITISRYYNEEGGTALDSLIIETNETLWTLGDKTLNVSLPMPGYYDFSIVPYFSDVNERGGIVSLDGPRLLITDTLPATEPGKYLIENFTTTPLEDAVLLQWTNPTNLTSANTTLTALNLIIRSYAAATGGEMLEETSMLLNDSEYTTAGAKEFSIALNSANYYEFEIIPVFTSFFERGVTATTDSRIQPLTPASYYFVEGFVATAEIDAVLLNWTNPANLTSANTTLTGLNLTIRSYAAATGGDAVTTNEILNNSEYTTAGAKEFNIALNSTNYYEFEIIPVFTSSSEVGIAASLVNPRIQPLPQPLTQTSYYFVEGFVATAEIDAVLLNWTNPANLTSANTTLTGLNLTIRSYAAATGGDAVTTNEILNDPQYTTAGANEFNITLNSTKYYEFEITPVFTSSSEVGIAASLVNPRIQPLPQPLAPPTNYYLVEGFVATTPQIGEVQLQWTNPTNLTSSITSLTGFNITIRSYADVTGDRDLQNSSLPTITEAIYRTSGEKNVTIQLASDRYYEFDIIPVFSNLNDRGIAVATSGARVMPPSLPDLDGDSVADVDDVDDDGDGLIEIRTANEFNMIRNNLAGTNLTATVPAAGNDSGCGNNADITECTGYELMNDISLSSYLNWIPIGTDQNKYTAIFDGNNNTISDINITTATEDRVGLFASLASASEVRNLRLRQVAISVENNFVGALAGEAEAALINNIGVTNININGSSNVGGLLGGLNGGSIANSSVREGIVMATNSSAGGLVGRSQSGSIDYSFARLQKIIATVDNAGGLVGSGSAQLNIISSYAQADLIETGANAGGILGYAGPLGFVMLDSSYAQIGTLRVYGNHSGSIIGRSNGTITVGVTNSYGVMGILENPAPESAGGLASSSMNLNIVSSYWDTNVTFTNNMITSDGRRTGNQTTAALQASAGGIFSNWDSSVWDFGENTEYPALRDLIGSTPAEQRSFIIRR